MTVEEQREQVIQGIAEMLRTTPFKVEFVAKKNPEGIKVIIEVTQEQMDEVMKQQIERRKGL